MNLIKVTPAPDAIISANKVIVSTPSIWRINREGSGSKIFYNNNQTLEVTETLEQIIALQA